MKHVTTMPRTGETHRCIAVHQLRHKV